jgi:hypothetical protein
MDNAHESTSESKIPVIYTKEHLEREAARKQRAAEKKQAEQDVEAARNPADYPVDALGPILGPAVEAIARKVQCPPALAGLDILSAMALAAWSARPSQTIKSGGTMGPAPLIPSTIKLPG